MQKIHGPPSLNQTLENSDRTDKISGNTMQGTCANMRGAGLALA